MSSDADIFTKNIITKKVKLLPENLHKNFKENLKEAKLANLLENNL